MSVCVSLEVRELLVVSQYEPQEYFLLCRLIRVRFEVTRDFRIRVRKREMKKKT